MRAARRTRGSQTLASSSVTLSIAPPLQQSRPPRLPVGPSRPNHGPEDPFVVLSGHPPAWGYLSVPLVPPEEHGIEKRVPHVP